MEEAKKFVVSWRNGKEFKATVPEGYTWTGEVRQVVKGECFVWWDAGDNYDGRAHCWAGGTSEDSYPVLTKVTKVDEVAVQHPKEPDPEVITDMAYKPEVKSPSPTRTYVAMCNTGDFKAFYFRKFTLPEISDQSETRAQQAESLGLDPKDPFFANTIAFAQWYYLNKINFVSCIERVFAWEDYIDLHEEFRAWGSPSVKLRVDVSVVSGTAPTEEEEISAEESFRLSQIGQIASGVVPNGIPTIEMKMSPPPNTDDFRGIPTRSSMLSSTTNAAGKCGLSSYIESLADRQKNQPSD